MLWIYKTFGRDEGALIIEALFADATEAEAKAIKVTDGLVTKLNMGCLAQRGNPNDQGDLFSPQLRVTPDNPNSPPITALCLQGVVGGSRAIALDLKHLWFQVCHLSHFFKWNLINIVPSRMHI